MVKFFHFCMLSSSAHEQILSMHNIFIDRHLIGALIQPLNMQLEFFFVRQLPTKIRDTIQTDVIAVATLTNALRAKEPRPMLSFPNAIK